MRNFEMGGTSFTADIKDPMIGGTMASSMAKGGGLRDYKGISSNDKFIADQLYYVISLKSIAEKKNTIKNSLLPNVDNYNMDETTKRITKDNLKYALQQKNISQMNNVLKGTINAFRNDEMAKGGGLKGKAKYVPNYMVQSVEVERKGKTTDIDGANILDGVYVKNGVKFAKGGGMKDIGFENSNLYLYGFGKDNNGNSVVKIGFPNQRAFSIQTNGVLKFTHDKRGYKLSELDSNDIKRIEKEVVEYVKNYGSKDQKSRLKVHGKMEWGGTAESSETGAFIGGENASSMYKRGGGLETAKISELKKDMIVYPIYGSYAGKKGYVNKIMPDNKTVEVIFKNKVGNEYVKFEGNELTTNLKYLNGGAMNETFPENDAMSYEEGGSTSTWSYSIGGL
jgi:hypothetical protein